MRAAVSQVGGKKELSGFSDTELEISNQCARLAGNAIIYYNSAILSRLLARGSDDPRTLTLIRSVSPAAWRHILINGHYTFTQEREAIDLDVIVAGLKTV